MATPPEDTSDFYTRRNSVNFRRKKTMESRKMKCMCCGSCKRLIPSTRRVICELCVDK